MAGNVEEWCAGWKDTHYYERLKAAGGDPSKVLAVGSGRHNGFGFRVAKSAR
jgi:formylglycine-generating enzyme required for sulfatase activity